MSRHEWEEGTIKIPRESYPVVRAAVISSYNRTQNKKLADARGAYEIAKTTGFRKRGFNRANWVKEHHSKVAWFITKQGSTKVYVPKRKDFKLLPTSKSAVLHPTDGVTIVFDNQKHTVFYSVDENNHACETARQNPVVVSLFANLRRVTNWTKKSGGQIFGNDEYNRGSEVFDGGSNYATESFGPQDSNFNGMYFAGAGRNW